MTPATQPAQDGAAAPPDARGRAALPPWSAAAALGVVVAIVAGVVWDFAAPSSSSATVVVAALAGTAVAAVTLAVLPLHRARPVSQVPPGLEVVGLFAHEIRSPLNAVVGLSGLLLDTRLDREQREVAETIRSGAESLHRAIDDFIDLSRIASDALEVRKSSFDPAATIDECLRTVRTDADERAIPLTYRVDPSVPKAAQGDVERIRRVVLVLLEDALRRNRGNGLAVRVAVTSPSVHGPEGPEYETRPLLQVSVRDEGTGSTPRFLNAGPVRLSAAAARSGDFRIAAARVLCEGMGGRVWSEPTAGGGSHMHATFPVSEAMAHAPADPDGGRLRLLVAEDDACSRSATMVLVRALGHEATPAANGREALDLLDRAPHDVVLLDVSMPVMDGIETARRISEGDRRRSPLMVAVTATATQAVRDACTAAGIDACIEKPLRAETLRDVLARAGAGRRTSAPPTPEPSVQTRLIAMYIADVPEQLSQLRDAAARGDAQAIARSAHRLKGSSAAVGAVTIATLASKVEQIARNRDARAAAEAVAQLVEAWPEARAALVGKR